MSRFDWTRIDLARVLTGIALVVGWVGIYFAFRGRWLGIVLPLVTTALTFAVDTVIPAGIGLGFLGDSTRPGYAPIAALGFVLTITGTLALATHDMTRAAVEGGGPPALA